MRISGTVPAGRAGGGPCSPVRPDRPGDAVTLGWKTAAGFGRLLLMHGGLEMDLDRWTVSEEEGRFPRMSTTSLSAKARALAERPVIANVATVDRAGRPQLTPVWIDIDGNDLVFNTARSRAKARNLEQNPNVAVSLVDPDDPYNVLVVRGTAEASEEGADAHIDALAKKYLGVDSYPNRRPGEVRVKYRVRPDAVVMQSQDS